MRKKVLLRPFFATTFISVLSCLLLPAAGPARAQTAVFWSRSSTGSSNGDLWITNGTSAGTKKVQVAGANSAGLLRFLGPGPDFTDLGDIALFAGLDTLGHQGLWVTGGTSATTKELKVPGANSNGLFDGSAAPDFTALGSLVLFEGNDASTGYYNLWASNGTSNGTKELKVKGASSTGLFYNGFPASFHVLGKRAFFVGNDTAGNTNLWVTDGTAAGTTEIEVAKAYSGGIFSNGAYNDPNFTTVGTKVLFQAADTNGYSGLWVTNGTVAGTSALTVPGTNTSCGPFCLEVPDITAIGGKAVFMAVDTSNHQNLWVTDGTQAGTKKLTVAKAYGGGLFGSLSSSAANFPPSFFNFRGKALFVGEDSLGVMGLWVTDGTSAGTKEIKAAGAYAGGLFQDNSVIGPNFTALGDQVLFVGKDAQGHHDLWVTDGTAAGTRKLAVAGAYSGGLEAFYSGSNAPLFTVLGDKIVFVGLNAQESTGLWVTDGKAADTKQLSQISAFDITVLK